MPSSQADSADAAALDDDWKFVGGTAFLVLIWVSYTIVSMVSSTTTEDANGFKKGLKTLKHDVVGSYFVANYPPFSVWSPAYLPAIQHALDTKPEPNTPLGTTW